jgi:UDP-3-O-[3-hydroxymyristoyl] N-acetylglucosamine deacetylase
MDRDVQHTLVNSLRFSGVGLHSGRSVTLVIEPAPADHGIVFERTDIPQAMSGRVAALWHAVADTRLCTRIENADGVSVGTIEHLMAALAGTGVHNALVRLDGPEVPILDGSARPFARAILQAGLRAQHRPLRVLRLRERIEVREGAALAALEPAGGLAIAFEIDFAEPAIGRQALELDMANGSFLRELADARTFCRASDVEAMRSAGLALGGSHENAVVFSGGEILSPGGLRRSDEPVRHKMLDALGDLALAGGAILGRYSGVRAGHALTNRLLRAVFTRPGAAAWEECSADCAARLPGSGISLGDLAA